ncbi:MAG: tetratricopeptide repeat protein [Pseudomonadota bacterium]
MNEPIIQPLTTAQHEWMLAVAYVYLQNQQYESAVVLLELVLSENTESIDAIKSLMYCYLMLDRLDECIKAGRRLLMLLPKPINGNYAKVYLILAKAFYRLGDQANAQKSMLKYRGMNNSHDV